MSTLRVQKALLDEGFPDHIAYYTSLAYFMNCKLKLKKKDFTEEGRYTKRLHSKIRAELSFQGLNNEDIDFVIEILNCCYSWTVSQDMAELGGCVKKTFRKLLEENKNKEVKE